jgi:hypothetical protein
MLTVSMTARGEVIVEHRDGLRIEVPLYTFTATLPEASCDLP